MCSHEWAGCHVGIYWSKFLPPVNQVVNKVYSESDANVCKLAGISISLLSMSSSFVMVNVHDLHTPILSLSLVTLKCPQCKNVFYFSATVLSF